MVRILDAKYLAPRCVYWFLLLAAAVADALINRTKKRRGYQLHRGVITVIAAYVVQDVLLLTFSSLRNKDPAAAGRVCQSYIFFTDLADALMIALLLTIAAGYCITRDNLGPHRMKAILIPSVFLATTLVVDFVVFRLQGNAICNVGEVVIAPESVPEQTFTSLEWGLLELCQLASLAALLLAWLFIFDITNKERASLEGFQEGIVGAVQDPAQAQAAAEAGTARLRGDAPSSGPVDGSGLAGHRVALPPEMSQGGPEQLQDSYAQVTGEDGDQARSVQDRLVHRTKLGLMTQFQWGVGTYVVCTAAALLLPLFLYSRPEQQATAVRAVLILQNLVMWGFLAVLCFIFRPQSDNPYLILEDDEANASAMTETGIGEVRDVRDVRTELGYFPSGELESPTKAKRRHSGEDSPMSLSGNFTLEDEEGAQPVASVPSRSRAGASVLKPRAATRDI